MVSVAHGFSFAKEGAIFRCEREIDQSFSSIFSAECIARISCRNYKNWEL
jgi:hypothetical protein